MKKILAIAAVFVLMLSGSMESAKSEADLTNKDGFVYQVMEDGSAAIVGYTGEGGDLQIPSDLDGHTVTIIWYEAFIQQRQMKSVMLPETIREIKDSAFFSSSITSVELPDSLETVGKDAFAYCDKLESVILPDSITDMGDNPFRECTGLKTITVSENHPYLEVIDGVLFSKPDHRLICCPITKGDSEYEIPDGIRIIGSSAFVSGNISKIIIPESVETIGKATFRDSQLSEINIPSRVEDLKGVFGACGELQIIDVSPDNASFESVDGVLFKKDTKMLVQYPLGRVDQSYTVPEGTEIIGDSAFSGSVHLKEIIFPETVKRIDGRACDYCLELESVILPDNLEIIGEYVFSSCKKLTKMNIPAGLKSIGGNPFYECTGLRDLLIDQDHPYFSIQNHFLIEKETMSLIWYPLSGEEEELTIPEGVKSINTGAFQNNHTITSVILPDGIEKINSVAFAGCDKLERIVLPSSLENIEKSAFHSGRRSEFLDVTCIVKAGSYAENFCQSYNIKIEYAD